MKLAFYRTLTTPLIALKNLDDDAENDEHIPLIVAEVTDFYVFEVCPFKLVSKVFNFCDTHMTLILKKCQKRIYCICFVTITLFLMFRTRTAKTPHCNGNFVYIFLQNTRICEK